MADQDSPFGYVQEGLSDVASGLQQGAARFYSDMAAMGAAVQPIFMHPQAQAMYTHHGMVMYEMSTTQAAGAALGISDAPHYMTHAEWGQYGAETFGQNIAGAAVYGGINTVAGFGLAGAGMAVPFTRLSRRSAQWAARGLGAGPMAGGSGVMRWIRPTARAGSIAARAGAITEGIGLGTTAGISLASGMTGVAAAGGMLALSMAPFMAADAAVSKVVDTARERAEIQDYIQASSFRYAPPSEWTTSDVFGGGYGRRAAGRIAEGIMGYEAQNPLYDMGELKGILQKGTQIGLFNTTRDAEDFQRRFKETADALKTVTKVMHVSLSEGLDTIKAMRDIGITDPRAQAAAINRADIMGLASGKTAAEMFTIGLQGSQVFRGTGVSLEAGAQANQMMFAQLTDLRRRGLISSEQVAQMGGEEAFAQTMTTGVLRYAQSPFGRGLMMSLAPTGELDPTKLEELVSGRTRMSEAFFQTSRAMSDPMNFVKFQLNQEKILGDLTQSFGGMGATVMPLAGSLLQAQETLRGMNRPMTQENQEMMTKFILKTQQGWSNEQIDASIKMLKDPSEMQKNMQAALQQNTLKMTREAMIEQYGIGNNITREWRGLMHETLGAAGINVGRRIDDIATWATGLYNRNVLGLSPVGTVDPNVRVTDEVIRNSELMRTTVGAPDTTRATIDERLGITTQRADLVQMNRARPTGFMAAGALGAAVAGIIAAPFTAGASLAVTAGALTLAGGVGFGLGVGGAALGNIMVGQETLGDYYLKSGKLQESDIITNKEEALRVGAVQVKDSIFGDKWIKKEAVDKIDQELATKDYKLTSADVDNKKHRDKLFESPERVAALRSSMGRAATDAELIKGIVFAGGKVDETLLSDKRRSELRAAEQAAAGGDVQAEKALVRLQERLATTSTMADLSAEGQGIVVAARVQRGEGAQTKEDLKVNEVIKGKDTRTLAEIQAAGKDAKERYQDVLRGALKDKLKWSSGLFASTMGHYEAGARLEDIAAGLAEDPEAQEALNKLVRNDKMTDQERAKLEGDVRAAVSRQADKVGVKLDTDKMKVITDRVLSVADKSDTNSELIRNIEIQKTAEEETAIRSFDITTKAGITAFRSALYQSDLSDRDRALASSDTLLQQALDVQKGGSTISAKDMGKTASQILKDTKGLKGFGAMQESFAIAARIGEGKDLTKAEFEDIARVTGLTAEEVQVKYRTETGKSELTAKALLSAPGKTAEATRESTETAVKAGLGGLPEVADAITVIKRQTTAVAEALHVIKELSQNLRGQSAGFALYPR